MALSDLELLQLVEAAKEKQKGPKGDPGVGIDRVEQFDNLSFTLRLSDGSFKKIELQSGQDGPVGPIGIQGERGEPGPPGRPGNDGAAGTDGKDGLPGRDGSYVDTAVVNGNGHLLLGLSDGQVIDVGRVVGPVGATGERGATGLPGEPGVDGAAVLSGPRAPQESDGQEGDHWIDISSAEFGFYKKGGNGWDKLANLRQPAQDRLIGAGVGGGNGNGGGGKSEPQNTRTLPLVNGGTTFRKQAETRGLPPIPGAMESQEDANLYILACLQTEDVTVSESLPRPPYAQGQLWFCTNPEDLTLYVYDGAVWVPAAPPVSLDGIEAGIAGLTYAVDELKTITTGQGQDIADAKSAQYGIATAIKHLDDDQQRQDEKIAEILGEIEDLQPSIERGEWVYEPNPEGPNSPAPGGYTAYVVVTEDFCKTQHSECLMSTGGDQALATECNRNFDSCLAKVGESDTDVPWHEVEWLVLHRNDIEGRNHLFGDVTPDMYVEALNADGTGHGLYQIISKTIDPRKCGLHVKPVHSSGHPNGKALFKIFKMAEAANPEDYVKKSGDTMTGLLTLQPTGGNALRVYASNEADERSTLIYAYGKADEEGNRKNIFNVVADGRVSISSAFNPTSSNHVTHKKYVDDAIAAALAAPAKYEYKCYINQTGASGTPSAGQAFIFGDTMKARTIQLSLTANNGPVPFQGANGLTMYYHKGDTKQTAMTVTCWYYRSGGPDWKWKGTAEIERVRLYMDYIEITTVADDSRKWANQDIGNAGLYRFTISGLF